ncbi:MAG TPA: adenylate/guanylate cyclase domain-containing protein, partial [bacterium]
MSNAALISPAAPATKQVRKRHLFSLRVKFILVLTFLIIVVMGVVTMLILYQMQQTLLHQIIDRGEAQARSLALNSVDQVIDQLSKVGQPGAEENISLPLMQSANETMKMGSGESVRNIPSGLAPWEEQILQYSGTLNDLAQKYLWPDDKTAKNSDMEYVKIVDKNAKIDGDNILQNVMEHVPYQPPPGVKPLGEEPMLTQAYEMKGRTFYDIAAPILQTAEGHKDKVGEVHIGMNQNTITQVVRYVGISIFLTTVAILLIGIIGMVIFITILIKPIGLLVNGVSAIAAGNFDQKINIKRADELGDLTDAFNNMAKSLREKEIIKGAFSKYVTKSVVDRILEHQDGLKLGGEKKVITIFFSDIRGFTPMSEVLSAEEVVHLLNEYFTAMTRIIFKYEGTLDKFMGDAIMAVYGAPIDMPDHAERAVLSAIEMSEKMKELQAKWKMEGKREVNIGIGINTGEAVVGNIGSNERMEYTAIGDNVNLTQRL